MPEYVLNRNYLLRSTLGFTIQFEKGVPAYVPPPVEREAVSIGAERVDGDNPDVLPPEAPEAVSMSDDERRAALYAAFDKIAARNDSKDFTGQGVPTAKAVEKLVPFDVERVELNTMWQQYKVKDAE
jgi:hypothetical protein